MKEAIDKFYTAFAELDAETMVSLYHDEVVFDDPAFGRLSGERAKNMWRMLCESQKDKRFIVQHSDVKATETGGSVRWEAVYVFSKTKRNVHNRITATFKFRDGKIIEHKDNFNLFSWSRQALGIAGYAMGWTPFFKQKLQKQTNQLLDRYEAKR